MMLNVSAVSSSLQSHGLQPARLLCLPRDERGCGPVTGKDRASCQSGRAPALRPGALAKELFVRQRERPGLPFCDTAPEQAPGNERAEQDTLPASRGGQRCSSLQSRPAEARRAPSSNSSGDSVHSEAQLPVHMLFLNPHLTLWPWVI